MSAAGGHSSRPLAGHAGAAAGALERRRGGDRPGAARAQALLDACALVAEATSFGGVRATAERRARWGTDAVPNGFIRYSAGCEDPDDLVADLVNALDVTR